MTMFPGSLWLASFIIYSPLMAINFPNGCPQNCSCNLYLNSSIDVECLVMTDSHGELFYNVSLPDHTARVYISVNTYVIQIPDAPFQGPSWNQILHLQLDGNGNIGSWRPSVKTFQSVRSVRYLYLRNAGIMDIENGSFNALPDLVVLDLSQNKGLHLMHLKYAMMGFSSPKLQVFNVSGVNSLEDTGLFTVDQAFMENLRGTRLTVLDISFTRLVAFTTTFRYYVPYLESLNASGTLLLGQSSCLSEMYVMESLKVLVLDKWPAFTRSRSIRSITNECIYANRSTLGDCFNIPPKLEFLSFVDSNINISYIFESHGRICMNPNNTIRRINLSGVQWTLSKLFSPITGLHSLEEFDISHTSLIDLHQDCFKYFPSLQTLNMGGNFFSGVAQSTLSKLFIWNGNLSHLNISWNNINSLPSDLLIRNRNITVLDMSHNYLKFFGLQFHREAILKLIDLSFNELAIIEPVFRDFISVHRPNVQGPTIYIDGNNLQCTCIPKSLELIQWILSLQTSAKALLVPPNITCIYQDNVVEISNEILSMLNTYCTIEYTNYFLYAIIGIFVTSCVAVFTMFDIWYCRKKNCISKLRTENSIYFQNDVGINILLDRKPDYAVFLSFSSNDNDFVIEYIWPKLETKLKYLLNKENKIIFVGDANFDVGRQICEEIISAASRCWCTVLIISNSFLDSDWCLFEVQSTWNSGCRIFPLFIEKCDGRKAKGIMKVVCQDMVRLLWPKDRADLQEQLFDSMCTQIVKHIKLHEQL